WFDPAQTDVARLGAALRAMPVPPSLSAPESAQAQAHGASLALTGAALLVSRSLRAGLQAPTSFGAALPLLGEALDDFIEHGITSHVLEAVAVGISIGRKDYFAANTTSFLLALGEYLEARIARRSDNMLCRLLLPTSDAVWVERRGREERLPPEQVRTGDTVIAATGTVIPVDGTVLGGEALVNEATMTGESVPVMRRRGDGVLSGTTVEEGRLRIYAERVGAQAAAARIAEFVQRSLTSKSDTQLAASRMADRLVPMVLALAALTWMASRDWQRVAAVLQADYSCALKLATPVAFKAAMYAAGRAGILVKGAQALERLAEADTFVFDKTGMLTHGRLEVTDSVALASGYRPEDLLNLAASVEEHYFHPLARAVVEASQQLDASRHFDHTEVEFIVAHGVASEIDGRRIVVGSRHFLEDHEGICVRPHAQTIASLARRGRTLLYVGYDQQLLGVIGLRDTLRENTVATLARLRAQGVRHIAMITGDCADNAQALARQLGLDAFYADVLPEDKAAIVEQMRAQ
ncbi:MAG: heavy metal translocating P-type ATPase, partial [Rhodocyclaceae bacterium]|nr:heavy metal translocating P-type ATPase [Rhodocyclaceae bacterium]